MWFMWIECLELNQITFVYGGNKAINFLNLTRNESYVFFLNDYYYGEEGGEEGEFAIITII